MKKVNDIADLTDLFNEVLAQYLDGEQVVDFDSWSLYDMLEIMSILDQAIALIGEEYADFHLPETGIE